MAIQPSSELSSEQLRDLDTLLGFAIVCARYKENPLTYALFAEAVNERMPEKSEQERQYLLGAGSQFLYSYEK